MSWFSKGCYSGNLGKLYKCGGCLFPFHLNLYFSPQNLLHLPKDYSFTDEDPLAVALIVHNHPFRKQQSQGFCPQIHMIRKKPSESLYSITLEVLLWNSPPPPPSTNPSLFSTVGNDGTVEWWWTFKWKDIRDTVSVLLTDGEGHRK